MDILTVIIIGTALWILLAVIEKVYILTRHYQRARMAERLANDLSKLALSHNGYFSKETGPCICKPHHSARLTIRAWNELGGKLRCE